MRTEQSVSRVFGDFAFNPLCYYNYALNSSSSFIGHIEIPVNTEEFDIPCFALNRFTQAVYNRGQIWASKIDAIVVNLRTVDFEAPYKTFEPNFNYYASYSIDSLGLVPVKIKEGNYYYISQGSIFNEDFKPIAIYSWHIKRHSHPSLENKYRYELIRPTLIIDSSCFTEEPDSVKRFITNKLCKLTLLPKSFWMPYMEDRRYVLGTIESPMSFSTTHSYDNVKVEVEKMPFVIKQVEKPCVSTTNSELLKFVLDNFSDLET